jgi:phage-related protein
MGPGVFEIALPFRGDAYRVVYAVQLADEVWVVLPFKRNRPKALRHPNMKLI